MSKDQVLDLPQHSAVALRDGHVGTLMSADRFSGSVVVQVEPGHVVVLACNRLAMLDGRLVECSPTSDH